MKRNPERAVLLPTRVKQETLKSAQRLTDGNTSAYARRCIRLLGIASAGKFSPQKTRLILPDGEQIPLPSPLKDPTERLDSRIDISGLQYREREAIRIGAEIRGIPERDFVRRALTLGNTIVTHEAEIPTPFNHNGLDITIDW